MGSDFVMSVRAVQDGRFIPKVGPTRYLFVPDGELPDPGHAVSAARWFKAVREAAVWLNEAGQSRGDLLFMVHGYNMSEAEVMDRHRLLQAGLKAEGFKGVLASFDWPSDDKALAYLPDRHRAKLTALQLVNDGIQYLSARQTPDCTINVHALGHSTGAYVIREAFDDADDTAVPNPGWGTSQIIFAAGDVSSSCMTAEETTSDAVYRHCTRFTNYFSKHDEALDLSNAKRLGTAPRAGRVGLPKGAPPSAVDVDCTAYYEQLAASGSNILGQDQPNGFKGMQSHSWYFGNRMFSKDLFFTLIGKERTVIPTRDIGPDGVKRLKHID